MAHSHSHTHGHAHIHPQAHAHAHAHAHGHVHEHAEAHATPTHTPRPSGKLRASPAAIAVGERTRVEAYDVVPSDLRVTFRFTPPPTIDPAMGTGLGCLPAGVDGSRLTLRNKLLVLNCLVFSTPHSFWVAGDGVRDAEALRTDARWSWIGTGDWECSFSPDGPLTSCLKHDVAYSSLKKFAGVTVGSVSNGLDEAWNPRNKALSDMKFRADIMVHGCQDSTTEADDWVCPPFNRLEISTDLELAWWYYFGVAWLHSLGWTYTHYDIEHIRQSTYRYAEYHIPSVSVVRVSASPTRLVGVTGYTVSWTYNPGTVRTATVSRYRLCWTPLKGSTICRTPDDSELSKRGGILSYELSILGTIQSLKSVEIQPDRRRLLGLGRSYYPPQEFNLRYGD